MQDLGAEMIVGAFKGRVGSRARYSFYALAGVAAAIVIALVVFDASALGMSEPSGVQRASGWAW